jgi:hypothetical protein
MPAITVPKDAIASDPGYLYYAAVGSALPTNTVAGSVFTDTWPAAWFALGATRDGSTFNYSITTDQIVAAEYFDPLRIITTGREAGITFDLYQVHATNMKRALNGGTLTPSGAGATLKNEFTPPNPGSEVRCMIGWESQDGTERLVAEQCFQVGSLQIARKKGAENASLPLEFRFEVPSSGFVFRYYTAGTVRA